ncbi:MAG: right-handed parallel beta-helix repeat-containing protein, partial [Coleofasciculus sp. S288]|nr:right-handed parallel beta-helix repeat-containing protein [Coleofasciculus sp. S288]
SLSGNGNDGLDLDDTATNSSVSVKNSSLTDNGEDGIELEGTDNTLKVEKSDVSGNADDGLDVNGSANDVSINKSSFSDNLEDGVAIEGSDNTLTINKSAFSNNGSEAIADRGSGNTVIVTDSTGASILLPIENAGFEAPTLADGDYTFGSVPGWEIYDPNDLVPNNPTNDTSNISVFNPDAGYYPGEAPEGNNVGDVYLIQDPFSGFAGLSQTIDTLLAPNTQYTLEVEVGNAAGSFEGFDLTGFPGYRVELLAGGQVLSADDNTLSIAEGTFGTSTVTYNSAANDPLLGEPLGIRLINPLQGPGLEVSFDNVQLRATQI